MSYTLLLPMETLKPPGSWVFCPSVTGVMPDSSLELLLILLPILYELTLSFTVLSPLSLTFHKHTH